MKEQMSVYEAIDIIKNIVVTCNEETVLQTLKNAALAQQTTNQQSTPPCAGCNHVPTVECLSSRLRTGNC